MRSITCKRCSAPRKFGSSSLDSSHQLIPAIRFQESHPRHSGELFRNTRYSTEAPPEPRPTFCRSNRSLVSFRPTSHHDHRRIHSSLGFKVYSGGFAWFYVRNPTSHLPIHPSDGYCFLYVEHQKTAKPRSDFPTIPQPIPFMQPAHCFPIAE